MTAATGAPARMRARRASENPILTPAMVRPSRPDLEVVGVFNPGAIRHGKEIILLLRVAEAPVKRSEDEVAAAVYDHRSGKLEIKRWSRSTPGIDVSDPRTVILDGRMWLTSISHFRVARSTDGIHFEVESAPAMQAATELEAFGVEDPRITLIDGNTYWINYTAVSPHGIATGLASTRDFRTYERHGIIFSPPNRDVTIFPERINGRYAALHRPMPEGLGEPAIWIAWSPDLLDWGHHLPVAGTRNTWDNLKIGGGAVPFRVNAGGRDAWLAIYHGVTKTPLTYSLGALLLDVRDPAKVLGRSRDPILAPETPYEKEGFFAKVVFTCGVIPDGDTVHVYYGAADGVTAVADLSVTDILAGLE